MCKTLTSIVYYSMIANTAWMFVEALFLHARLTVNVFNKSDPFYAYYFIGWGNVAFFYARRRQHQCPRRLPVAAS